MIMTEDELRYGDAERQVVDVLVPPGPAHRIALCYLHGGGWYGGRRQDFAEHLDHFAGRGHVVASVGYRIEEETGYRDKIGDVAAGLRSFRALLAERAPETDRIVLLGSSAGAHLATMLALRPEDRDATPPVVGCVAINPPGTMIPWPGLNSGLRTKIDWLRRDGSTAEEMSPERQVGPGCPPFLFPLAEYEHIFPHDQVRALAERIERHGGRAETFVVPGTKHGFVYRLGSPATDLTLARIEAFLDRLGG